jgi:hypothetical protein
MAAMPTARLLLVCIAAARASIITSGVGLNMRHALPTTTCKLLVD